MKGTEKIIAHIEADAQAKADEIFTAAERKCAEIKEKYDEKAASLYTDKIREGVKACQDKEDSALRISSMEAKKSILSVKQEMVSQSFAAAREKIVNLPKEQYVAFLAKLAAQASVTGDEEIILNARDREAIGEDVVAAANAAVSGGKMTLSDTTGDFAGGLILKRGNVEANCTVELLVDLKRGDLSAKLAEVLFGN